jgi:MOSC domain-containing protein YiiM
MEIVSTNIGKEQILDWKGRSIATGIVKEPVEGPIFLDTHSVKGDFIASTKVHGGIDKACYAYGENYYNYWTLHYPAINSNRGLLGENLTIADLDESEIMVGDIYKVGEAILQASQPRQPCSKLAAKLQDEKAIKRFIEFDHPGVYFRVIQTGRVQNGDRLSLDLRNDKALSIQQIFHLLYDEKEHIPKEMVEQALFDPNLSASTKKDIQNRWPA